MNHTHNWWTNLLRGGQRYDIDFLRSFTCCLSSWSDITSQVLEPKKKTSNVWFYSTKSRFFLHNPDKAYLIQRYSGVAGSDNICCCLRLKRERFGALSSGYLIFHENRERFGATQVQVPMHILWSEKSRWNSRNGCLEDCFPFQSDDF